MLCRCNSILLKPTFSNRYGRQIHPPPKKKNIHQCGSPSHLICRQTWGEAFEKSPVCFEVARGIFFNDRYVCQRNGSVWNSIYRISFQWRSLKSLIRDCKWNFLRNWSLKKHVNMLSTSASKNLEVLYHIQFFAVVHNYTSHTHTHTKFTSDIWQLKQCPYHRSGAYYPQSVS